MKKRYVVWLIAGMLFGASMLWAATRIRSATIINSTLDSSPVGATTPSTGAFTTLTCTTCPTVVPVFSSKSLSSNVGISANTLTTIDSLSVTMPASGGPFRVEVCYSYGYSAGTGVSGEFFVTDGTNSFAVAGQTTGSGGGAYSTCGWSVSTYANGSNPTFTTKVQNTGSQTITTSSPITGTTSRMQIAVFSSM